MVMLRDFFADELSGSILTSCGLIENQRRVLKTSIVQNINCREFFPNKNCVYIFSRCLVNRHDQFLTLKHNKLKSNIKVRFSFNCGVHCLIEFTFLTGGLNININSIILSIDISSIPFCARAPAA